MKAVVFTTDAIFALIVASVAVTILLYFTYTPQTPLQISYSKTQSILSTLISLKAGGIANGSAVAKAIVNQNSGGNNAWMQYGGNATKGASAPYGPVAPSVVFRTNTYSQALLGPVAGYGNVYFGSGNRIYAINGTSGIQAWNASVGTAPNSLALYNNMLLYANTTNMTALYANTGKKSWSVTTASGNPLDCMYIGSNVYCFTDTGGYEWTTSWVSWIPPPPGTVAGGPLSCMYIGSNVYCFTDTGGYEWTTSWVSWIPPPPGTTSTVSSQLLISNGQEVYGTKNNSVVGLYAANGGVAWGSNNIGFVPVSLAAINGSIAAGSSAGGLGLLNGKGTLLWYNTPSNSVTTGIGTLGNLIAYGSGSNACATYVNGTQAFCTSVGSNVVGVSATNGKLLYQTANSVYELSSSGSVAWSKAAASGIAVGYPVASNSVVYSGWSSGNLIAMGLTSGSAAWSTTIPYGAPSNMILAYGRLYAVSGNSMIAYGACYPNSQSSLLSTTANLYLNGDGSCGTALLNGLYPIYNYSLSINGSVVAGQRLASFNGISSYISTGTAGLPTGSSTDSGFAWIYLTATPGSGSYAFIYSHGGPSHGAAIFVNSADHLWFGDPDVASFSSSLTVPLNTWTFVGYSYSSGSVTLYLDGQSQSETFQTQNTGSTYSDIGIDGRDILDYFKGSIADVQVYSTALNSSQISSLYSEGLWGGPLQKAGLVSWWPLDGDTNDYGGYNNTGYPINLGYRYSGYAPSSLKNSFEVSKSSSVLPLSSYVASFNGASSYVSTGTSGFPTGSAARSFFAWVYYTGTPSGGDGNVWINWYGTNTGDELSALQLIGAGGGSLYFTGSSDDFYSSLNVPKNSWNFVGYTYSAGSDAITMYLDGKAQTGTISAALNTVSTGTSTIGYRPGAPVEAFGGDIADVQVYNTTLSSAQAAQLYSEGVGGLPVSNAGLVGWWPLNGNANDYSGQWNNGAANAINYTYITSPYSVGVLSWR